MLAALNSGHSGMIGQIPLPGHFSGNGCSLIQVDSCHFSAKLAGEPSRFRRAQALERVCDELGPSGAGGAEPCGDAIAAGIPVWRALAVSHIFRTGLSASHIKPREAFRLCRTSNGEIIGRRQLASVA
jgi:hypothetical protein